MKHTKTNKHWHKLLGMCLALSMTAVVSLSAEPKKIMMMGDSITVGDAIMPDYPEANLSTYGNNDDSNISNHGHIYLIDQIAYRGELWKILKDNNYSIAGIKDANYTDPSYDANADLDFVGRKHTFDDGTFYNANANFDDNHEGHPGYTSEDLLGEIDDILDANTPDIVLLHIGTNDAGSRVDMNTTTSNVKGILDAIFAKNLDAKIFVARIIEVRKVEAWGGEWNTKAFNDTVAAMVAAHPSTANIKMVDLEGGAEMIYNPCGTDNGDMQPFHIDNNNSENNNTYDFHPNKNGYKKMAQKWFDDMNASGWLDTEKPVIALKGDNPQIITVGGVYHDLNATVSDNEDVNRSIEGTGSVDTSVIGNYTITYDANDTAGNVADTVTRTVEVTAAPDTAAPTITLLGDAIVNIKVGDTYTDAGATALDAVDGNVTADIAIVSNVVTTTEGSYTVTYNVSDEANNTAETVTRTVNVTKSTTVIDNDWSTYDKVTKTATITPTGGGAQSTLMVGEGLSVALSETATSLSLKHVLSGGKEAYVTSQDNGKINTGFKNATSDDGTLKTATFFKAGSTASIIKVADKVTIEIEVTLSKDELLTTGGN